MGKTLPVLFERKGRNPGQLLGKTPYLQIVWVDAPEALIGQIAPVEIDGRGPNSLSGRLVGTPGGLARSSTETKSNSEAA